jgi:hypothetical protein
LAVVAAILLVTSELLWTYRGKAKILINRGRLRNIAIVFALVFLVSVGIRIVGIFVDL